MPGLRRDGGRRLRPRFPEPPASAAAARGIRWAGAEGPPIALGLGGLNSIKRRSVRPAADSLPSEAPSRAQAEGGPGADKGAVSMTKDRLRPHQRGFRQNPTAGSPFFFPPSIRSSRWRINYLSPGKHPAGRPDGLPRVVLVLMRGGRNLSLDPGAERPSAEGHGRKPSHPVPSCARPAAPPKWAVIALDSGEPQETPHVQGELKEDADSGSHHEGFCSFAG